MNIDGFSPATLALLPRNVVSALRSDMSPLKVLLVHNYYQQPGGEDRIFEAEGSLLESYGHPVIRYVARNEAFAGLRQAGVGLAAFWNTRVYLELERLIRAERPDVVHFHNTFPLISPAAYYACQALNVPVVQTLHNYRLVCPVAVLFREGRVCEECLGRSLAWPGILHGCYRNSRLATAVIAGMVAYHRSRGTWSRSVDRYIAYSHFAMTKFVEGGIPRERLAFKTNFVAPDPGFVPGGGDYALFVGRLAPEKGIHALLHAWRHLAGIPLRIVGDGPLGAEVQHFVADHFGSGVELVGRVDGPRVVDLIRGARFLIVPSLWPETFCRVVIEAFACGVPVLAARIGALAELVDPRENGFHFAPGDTEDMARVAERAWTHPKETAELARGARRTYLENYTAEANYPVLMRIYHEVLSYRGHTE